MYEGIAYVYISKLSIVTERIKKVKECLGPNIHNMCVSEVSLWTSPFSPVEGTHISGRSASGVLLEDIWFSLLRKKPSFHTPGLLHNMNQIVVSWDN